ncbi:MAG: phosphatase PAP2 family protein [Tatlockia sp.]|nr:phosphatase PAP2 family protein [Tatlockia sp.]
MPIIARYFNLITAAIICLLSFIALVINHCISKFPGNDYFPPGVSLLIIILGLILLGSWLFFDKNSVYFKIARELVYYFLVISVVALATNAAQFAPFNPIDKHLVIIDNALGIHLEKIVAWIITQPWLTTILALSYDSLPLQMTYLPIILIFACKFSYLREYYALMLITTLIGFVFYYFWPTIGPASVLASPYFSPSQYATGIKFVEIHSRIQPSTIEGGMIAMPSFHAIWALLCLKLARCWPVLLAVLLPLNLLLIASCVLLGWHYFIDLVGSFVVLILAYFIYYRFVVVPSNKVNLNVGPGGANDTPLSDQQA